MVRSDFGSRERPVAHQLLNSMDAASALGVSVNTLYGWLNQSNAGSFEIRGQSVTIDYFQGGKRGQGRIKIESKEIDRLLALMRVGPKPIPVFKRSKNIPTYQHITSRLGRPDD